MQKLELKHLAPYLPYGLKLKGTEQKIFGIKDAEYEMFKLSKGLNGNLIISGRVRSEMGGTFSIGECEIGKESDQFLKPILRPIKDLGLMQLDGEDEYFSTWVTRKTGFYFDRDFDFEIETKHADDIVYHSLYSSIAVFNLLLEYHFDVFGLIDAGLAINKLTTESHA